MSDIYYELAIRYDQGMVGAPMTASLIRILKLSFHPEEAEIALKIPFEKKTLSELLPLFPGKEQKLEKTLEKMAWRGTVFINERPGKEKRYNLFHSLPGWTDTLFWANREANLPELASAWVDYRKEEYSQELARGAPLFRVIPLETSISDISVIGSYDDMAKLVRSSSYLAVGLCVCRQSTELAGQGCHHMKETCISLGSMARYLVNQSMAREVTIDQAMDVLNKARDDSLIYMTNNVDEKPASICCCCSCCCMFIKPYKENGLATISSANYRVETDPALCTGCEECLEKCQIEAISRDGDGTVKTDTDLCVGCGLCSYCCPQSAKSLVVKSKISDPPTGMELFLSRIKPGPDYKM